MRNGYRKFSKREVLRAISNSGGVIEAVAQKLGAERTTVRRYINEDKDYARAMHEARERFKDMAENKLMAAINNGNLTAIIFALKTQAKDRGYSEYAERDDRQVIQFKISQDEADY